MATHEPRVLRTAAGAKEPGVYGACSCRQRQMKAVPSKALAEDWIDQHMRDVVRAVAGLRKHLSDIKYLEYLRECQLDEDRSESERDQWRILADEMDARLRGRTEATRYNTGVETEPLFDV